jgi:rhodanese-related sulfurtransferase
MRRLLLTLALPTLSLAALLCLTACKPGAKPLAQLEPPLVQLPDTVRLLDPAAAQALVQKDPKLQIIDCRGDDEFRSGHLPRAHHANYFTPDLARERLTALDPTRPTLLYCALGERSRHIALMLVDLGFQDIALLEGGTFAWTSAGLPLER